MPPQTPNPLPPPQGRITRYLGIYGALWKNSVSREMTFKSNFLMWIVVELLWFCLQLSFIGVLYLHTDNIRSWTKWEVVLLIGGSHLIQQMFQAFFLINCTNLSELIRTGKLDFLLLLPVNTVSSFLSAKWTWEPSSMLCSPWRSWSIPPGKSL